MTTYYLKHGAYTYADSPTFGTAQEGDGTSTSLATVATTSIDLTLLTAVAGDTFVIGSSTTVGAILTCVTSGAGNNQFNAGTGVTLADNLVTAINRSTNTVTVLAPTGTTFNTPKIQDATFARRTGTATLEIQTRAGSASYNSNANFKCYGTGGLSSISAVAFTGGAGGCWGWFTNDNTQGAIWKSAMAVATYGASRTTLICGNPLTVTDICYIYGGDTTLTFSANANYTIGFDYEGSWIVASNTEWSGSTGYFRFSKTNSSGSTSHTFFSATTAGKRIYMGAVTQYKLQFNNTSVAQMIFGAWTNSMRQDFIIDNAQYTESSTYAGQNGFRFGYFNTTSAVSFTMLNSKYLSTRTVWNPIIPSGNSSSVNQKFLVENCIFDFQGYFTGTPTYLFDLSGITIFDTKWNQYIFRGNTVTGLSGGNPYVFGGSFSNPVGGIVFIVENSTGVNVQSSIGLLGGTMLGQVYSTGSDEFTYHLQQGIGSPRQYRLETSRTTVAFDPNGNYPVLNAILPDGTGWSYQCLWAGTVATYWERKFQTGLEFIKTTQTIVDNSGLASTPVVTLEILNDPAISASVTNQHLGIAVTYTKNSDSTVVTEYSVSTLSRMKDTASTLASSSASWTLNGFSTYTKQKITATLSTKPKNNTEVEVKLLAFKYNPGSSNVVLFADPAFTIV